MAKYLEQGDEIDARQLHAPFEKALREGHLVPVCFISARTGAGVEELLDVLVELAPNPLRRQSAAVLQGRGRPQAEEFRSEPDPKKHVLAHVFKVVHRPVRRQARHVPRAPGHDHARHAALHRRRQEALQGRPPVHAAGREARRRSIARSRATSRAVAKVDEIDFDAVLHDSHDEDQHPHAAARVPAADARPGDRAEEARRRAADLRRAAQDGRRGPDARRRAGPALQRDGDARAWATCTCAPCSSAWPSQYKLEIDTRPPRIPYRETITRQAEGHAPPQEADRRRRAVRRSVPARRAAAARRRLRVRRRDQGRRDPAPVHPGGARRASSRCSSTARSPASRCRTSA